MDEAKKERGEIREEQTAPPIKIVGGDECGGDPGGGKSKKKPSPVERGRWIPPFQENLTGTVLNLSIREENKIDLYIRATSVKEIVCGDGREGRKKTYN